MSSRLKYALLASSLLLSLSTSLHAQGAADARKVGGLSDQDRAKRDASKVFSFIKFHAVKPTAPVAAAAASPAAVPQTAAAPAPAPRIASLDPAKLIAEAPPAAIPAAPAESVASLPVSPGLAVPVAPVPEAEPDLGLQLIEHVEPEMPRPSPGVLLRSGAVVVRFAVGLDGRVTSASAREGAQRKLAQSAVKAVQQWRFAPLASPREAEVEIAFNLD